MKVKYETNVVTASLRRELEKINLPQRTRIKMKMKIDEERGILTTDFLKELDRRSKALPKTRIDLNSLNELYYEGKMLC